MKYNLLYLLILFSLPLFGQYDTIKIKEVVISRKQIASENPGFKKTVIDSGLLLKYSNFSFSELLSGCSPLFIKSYGSGGTATVSFRGTGASHTQVAWNGININSPMLGQSDFSLLIPGLTDNVQICYGGASMDIGSGGFGGIINIENKPVWSNNTGLFVSPGSGSFGHYSVLAKLKSGNENFQTVTKVFLQSAENNFPYLNTEISAEPVREVRKNSQVMHKDFLQELYFRRATGILSARFWYQSTSRNLPGSMLTQQSDPGEKQYDESFRSILKYETEKGSTGYFITGAWMHTKLNYTNRIASIRSDNLSNSFILRGGVKTDISHDTELKIVLSGELNAIETNNYNSNVSRNTASVTVSAERRAGNRFGTTLLIREILDSKTFLFPDFSAGIEFRVMPGEEHYLRATVTRNSRIPSMNDRYWIPGGDPELRNEYAYLYELGYKLDQELSPSVTFNSEVTFFSNRIRDMIQWQPGEYSYWIARNVGSVNSSGLESGASLKYVYNDLNFRLNTVYSYIRSVSAEVEITGNTGNQLMYIPEHQVNSSAQLSYKNLYAVWITDFTGRRFISVDNTRFLPAYTVNTLISGIKLNHNKTSVDMSFRAENLFNKSYQTIVHHPQPGRSYFISVSVNINKH